MKKNTILTSDNALYTGVFIPPSSPGALAVLGVKPCKNSEHQVFGTVEKFRISSFISQLPQAASFGRSEL